MLPAAAAPSLPRHCPILILGYDGEWTFYIDAAGQFLAFEPTDLTPAAIAALAGDDLAWLQESFPASDRHKFRFDAAAARRWLFDGAARRGPVSPTQLGFDIVRRRRRFVWVHRNG